MIKRLVVVVACAFSISSYAFTTCPQASQTNDPSFCPTFMSSAQCHCTEAGLPKSLCQDMDTIYNRMISIFGTLQKACQYQHDTSTQNCIDDWNCYRNGGNDSQGRLCSSTGKSC